MPSHPGKFSIPVSSDREFSRFTVGANCARQLQREQSHLSTLVSRRHLTLNIPFSFYFSSSRFLAVFTLSVPFWPNEFNIWLCQLESLMQSGPRASGVCTFSGSQVASISGAQKFCFFVTRSKQRRRNTNEPTKAPRHECCNFVPAQQEEASTWRFGTSSQSS